MRLLAEGKSFEEIAQIRDRQVATVVGLVADLVEKGRLSFRRIGSIGRTAKRSKKPARGWACSG